MDVLGELAQTQTSRTILTNAGKLPLVTSVSDGGDAGRPVMVQAGKEGDEVRQTMRQVGNKVWEWLARHKLNSNIGTRG